MLHQESSEVVTKPDPEPIKEIPLEEDFEEDLYELYGVYTPEFSRANHHRELVDLY